MCSKQKTDDGLASSIHAALDSDPRIASLTPVDNKKAPVISNQTRLDLAAIHERGYIIIKNLLAPSVIQQVRDVLKPHLERKGRNNFEGYKTQRVYGIVSKSRLFDDIACHPRVIALLDQLLLPNYLLTANQAINIFPGETPQPYHHDDAFMNVPRPRRHLSVGTIWAIDDFTADNGATVVFPKSHKWGPEPPPVDITPISAVMGAGSVLVFLGTTWHGGGRNVTANSSRMCVTFQYCEPWCRPQENMMLSIPPRDVLDLPPRMQSLIGYSIHPPFIGHVNGIHPLKFISRSGKDEAASQSRDARL